MVSQKHVVTIGAGCAGLSFSYHWGHERTEIYEQSETWGGHCASHVVNGYTFDEGPHISFTTNDYVKNLFAQSTTYTEREATIKNYYHGLWIDQPVQTHLFPLDAKTKVDAIQSFVERESDREINTYSDWLRASFGDEISRRFYDVYTEKYWTVPPHMMSTEWINQRVYQPDLREVLAGSMSKTTDLQHYLTTYRYPSGGGYREFLSGMAKGARISANRRVERIDPVERMVHFEDGSSITWDVLVSSMPLNRLVASISPRPRAWDTAVKMLTSTGVVLVNLGVSEPIVSPSDWIYVYDPELLPVRLSFPSRFASCNVPNGKGSVQAEIYFSEFRPLAMSMDSLIEGTVAALIRMGLLANRSDVELAYTQVINPANILFTTGMTKARDWLLKELEDLNIHGIGRFGRWDYLWSDEAVMDGVRLSGKLSASV